MASDATNLANLKTRRDAIYAELAALNSTKAGGKPDSRQGGIDHHKYKMGLYAELKEIREAITAAGGSFEVITRNA